MTPKYWKRVFKLKLKRTTVVAGDKLITAIHILEVFGLIHHRLLVPITNGTPCSQKESFVYKVIFGRSFSLASNQQFVFSWSCPMFLRLSVSSLLEIYASRFSWEFCDFVAVYWRDLLRLANHYAAISVGRAWRENFSVRRRAWRLSCRKSPVKRNRPN